MGLLLLITALLVTHATVSSGALIKGKAPFYREEMNITFHLLKAQCPQFLKTTQQEGSESSVPLRAEVAQRVYTELKGKLQECQALNLRHPGKPTVSTPTQPEGQTTPASPMYKDCQEYFENGYEASGVYQIAIPGSKLKPFNVWCDFFNNHGWTVIQKRGSGSLSFDRNWNDYKRGFGTASGEYWIGNDRIHALTKTNKKLNAYIETAEGIYKNGYWSKFSISDESDDYTLSAERLGYYGTMDDKFAAYLDGRKFTTKDRDNDRWDRNCAEHYHGGWWYYACYSANLNGSYGPNGTFTWLFWYTKPDPPPNGVMMSVTRD